MSMDIRQVIEVIEIRGGKMDLYDWLDFLENIQTWVQGEIDTAKENILRCENDEDGE